MSSHAQAQHGSSVEENVATMRKWFEDVWNHGDYEIVRDRMAQHAVGQGQSDRSESLTGPEEFIAFATRIRTAFPDMRLKVEDIFGAGDRVAIRWTAVMTHTGHGLDIAPTNLPVETNGITIVQMVNGMVAAGWDCWDQAGMMHQLTAKAG